MDIEANPTAEDYLDLVRSLPLRPIRSVADHERATRPRLMPETAGSPRGISPPRLPQIRTCPIRASGSSCHALATGRHTEWIASAGGSG